MSPVPARPSPTVDRAEGFGILDDDFGFDFDDTSIKSLDPEEYFAYIPPEIKASRLPGTNERYAPAMIFGLLLLLGLNIGAIFLVFMRLNGA